MYIRIFSYFNLRRKYSYGFYSRLWGLALDRIIGVTAVLANGSIVTASATQHPELFYVCLLPPNRIVCSHLLLKGPERRPRIIRHYHRVPCYHRAGA